MRPVFYVIAILAFFSCKENIKNTADIEGANANPRIQSEYNFKLIVSTDGINDPSKDKREFYKVFINKSEEGRTTIGLESQDKYYEHRLPANRHLILIEKFVLDEKTGAYVKLNNIDQPKPPFYYLLVNDKDQIILRVKIRQDNSAVYTAEYE